MRHKLTTMTRVSRAVVLPTIMAAVVGGLVVTAALASSSAPISSTSGHTAPLPFEVLSMRTSSSVPAGVPAGAIRATNAGEHEVYVWRGSITETATEGSHNIDQASSEELCVFSVINKQSRGSSCDDATFASEHGIVEVERILTPVPRPTTVIVLAPNNVNNITVYERDGTSRAVATHNNVAVIENNNLAVPPATAISYPLPDGTTEQLPMPAGEPVGPQ